MLLQELQEERGCRNVRFARDFLDYAAIIEIAFTLIIKIFGVEADVKDAIFLDAIRLMHLKVEAERFHIIQVVIRGCIVSLF